MLKLAATATVFAALALAACSASDEAGEPPTDTTAAAVTPYNQGFTLSSASYAEPGCG